MEGVYHVVCHDCQFEGLYESDGVAIDVYESHEAEHGHRVSYLEITRPEPLAEA